MLGRDLCVYVCVCLPSTGSHSNIVLEISLQLQQQLFNLSHLGKSFLSSAANGQRIHLSVCMNTCVCVCVSDSIRVIFLKYS